MGVGGRPADRGESGQRWDRAEVSGERDTGCPWALLAVLALVCAPGAPVGAADVVDDAPSPPTRFGLRGDAVEVTGARGETTKRFRLLDGSFAEVATGRSLHVPDVAGRWRNSQVRLTPRSDQLLQAASRLRAHATLTVCPLSGNSASVYVGTSPWADGRSCGGFNLVRHRHPTARGACSDVRGLDGWDRRRPGSRRAHSFDRCP